MGVIEAETKKELGEKVIEHVGLGLEPDDNIGKQIRFKNVKYPAYRGVFTISGKQKVYGYDENGKYKMIEGYRVINEENQFGIPCTLVDIEFI